MSTRIGHRVEGMADEALKKELAENKLNIKALKDVNRAIKNELYHRKMKDVCKSCQGKGQYHAGMLLGWVDCPDCNK